MPTIKDWIESGAEKGPPAATPPAVPASPPEGGAPDRFLAWLKTPASPKPIESYESHPMAFTKNKHGLQMLRGLDALLGGLGLAIVDVVWGGLGWLWDSAKGMMPKKEETPAAPRPEDAHFVDPDVYQKREGEQ